MWITAYHFLLALVLLAMGVGRLYTYYRQVQEMGRRWSDEDLLINGMLFTFVGLFSFMLELL